MKKSDIIQEPQVEEVPIQDFLDTISEAQRYNDNINEHLPYYSSFKPLSHILIRIYRRLPLITKGGMIIDTPSATDWAKVMKQAGSGQDYAVNEAPTEFRFTKEAVVVSTPLQEYGASHKLQKGQKICIQQLQTTATKMKDDVIYYNYQFSFVHPQSGKTLVPSDCNDRDYGYALIPLNLIEGIIE